MLTESKGPEKVLGGPGCAPKCKVMVPCNVKQALLQRCSSLTGQPSVSRCICYDNNTSGHRDSHTCSREGVKPVALDKLNKSGLNGGIFSMVSRTVSG